MHTTAAIILGIFLIATGISHFAFPAYFRSLVPSWLRGAGVLVAVSGAVELVVGVLLLTHRFRAVGGWAAAGLITVFLASHLDALYRASSDRPSLLERPVGAVSGLVVNLLYIGWAVAVALAA